MKKYKMLVFQFQESTHRFSVLKKFLQERTEIPLTQLGATSRHIYFFILSNLVNALLIVLCTRNVAYLA